jgi:uncharacterized protein
MFRRIFLLLSLLAFIPALVFGYYSLGEPDGFVNDYANVMSYEQVQRLESKIKAFEEASSSEIAVVIIPSLEEDTIENFAVELFEDWGIGKKEKDNGVLILIAVNDRQMRIETGYGVEGYLTDAQCFWIIDDVMKPAFREGNYYEGINEAVDKIMSASEGEEIPSAEEDEIEAMPVIFFVGFFFLWLAGILGRTKSWWLGGVIGGVLGIFVTLITNPSVGLISTIVFIPLGLLIDYLVSRAYKEGKDKGSVPWWAGGGRGSGGSSSGGFGGFGGGSSGGGGASGSW